MLPLFVTLDTVTPKGSDLLFGTKNHSKFGEVTMYGKGLGVISAEQFRVNVSSTIVLLESEMVTEPISTALMNDTL